MDRKKKQTLGAVATVPAIVPVTLSAAVSAPSTIINSTLSAAILDSDTEIMEWFYYNQPINIKLVEIEFK